MFRSLGFDLLEFGAALAQDTSYILDVVKDGLTDDDTGCGLHSIIGSDLLEFVTAMAKDTSYILDVVVDGITEDDTGREASSVSSDDSDDEDNSSCDTGSGHVEEPSTAADEVKRRMNDVRTYLEPLLHREVEIYTIPLHLANQDDCACWEKAIFNENVYPEDSIEKKEILEFLEIFDISDKTEEIVRVLQDCDKTVSIHFRENVPMKVSYVEFWKRFFYRCDEQRVQRELDQAETSGNRDVGGLSKSHAFWVEAAPASPSSVLRDMVEWDPCSVEKLEESWE